MVRTGSTAITFFKSLVYFEDADEEPEPDMLVDFSWTEAKRYFVRSVRTFGAL